MSNIKECTNSLACLTGPECPCATQATAAGAESVDTLPTYTFGDGHVYYRKGDIDQYVAAARKDAEAERDEARKNVERFHRTACELAAELSKLRTAAPDLRQTLAEKQAGAGADDSALRNEGYDVICDRRDLFDFLRAAWRDGQDHRGEMDERERWGKATDHATKAIQGWATLRHIPHNASPAAELPALPIKTWQQRQADEVAAGKFAGFHDLHMAAEIADWRALALRQPQGDDSERIDWLERSTRSFCGNYSGDGWRVIGASIWHNSLRDAIDGARIEESERAAKQAGKE